MATKTPDQEETDMHGQPVEKPRFGPNSHSDDTFNNLINNNYSPDEQSGLSAASRGSNPNFKSPVDGSNSKPAKSASGPEINEVENQAGDPDKGKVDDKERSIADKLGKGFTGGAGSSAASAASPAPVKAAKMLGRIIGGKKGFTKKKAATGGVLGFLVGIVIFAFSIAQGPLQVIHLGEVLAKSFGNQDNANSVRMRAILKYARTGDYAETRLTYLESKLRARALPKLEANGVRFITDSDTAQLRGVRIDHKTNSFISNLSENEAKTYLANEFGVDEDKVRRIGGTGGPNGNGAIFAITEGARNMKFGRMMIISAFGLADIGKANTAVGLRPVANALGRPSLFHPWKKLVLKAEERTAETMREREKQRQQRNSGQSPNTKALNERMRSKLGEDGKVRTSLVGTLGLQAGVCIVHDIADAVPKLKKGNLAEPAASLAGDALGQSSQTKVGDDMSAEQPGSAVRNYKDKDGKTIWQGQALQALAGKPKPSGEDLDTDLKEGFSAKENGVEKALDAAGADAICSAPAQAIGAIAGIAIIASGPGGVLVKVGSSTVNMVASSAALYAVTSLVTKLIAGETPVVSILQGPIGGNLAAYGSRTLANMAYRPSGAVEMSKAQSAALALERQQEAIEKMTEKSFAQRIFNPYDYSSLIGHIVDYQTVNPRLNIQGLSSIISKPFMAINNFNLFFYKASAVNDKNYDWGEFREFAFSKEDLDNPKYQDSPENARIISNLLNSDKDKEFDGREGRAAKCFGVLIEKGPKGWDVIKDKDLMAAVDPGDEDYREANCKDRSENWLRLRFFIMDTGIVKQDECLNGDSKDPDVIAICKELGFLSEQDAYSSGNEEDASVANGSVKQLAQRMLKYKDQGKYKCDNAIDCEDLELTAEGKSIANGPCTAQALDKKTLQVMIYIIDSGYKIGTYALCRSHSAGSQHSVGKGIDISSINGKNLASDRSSRSLALEVNKLIIEIKGDLAPIQIITANVGSVRKVDPDFVRLTAQLQGMKALLP